MKLIKTILFVGITLFLVVSCNKTQSLDEFYVKNQEKQGFMVIDIPTSILKMDENKLTKTQKQAYKSINKLNFLAFSKNEFNQATYELAKKELKTVLKANKYNDLIRFNDNGKMGSIKYLGTPTAIKELVFFGAEDKKGFAVVRVLGNNMNPQNIFELLKSIKDHSLDAAEIKKITSFLGFKTKSK